MKPKRYSRAGAVVFCLVAVGILVLNCAESNTNAPGENEVWIENLSFNPSTRTIAPGTTITWTNKDNATHSVTSDSGLFDSPDLATNDTYSRLFDSVGTFPYHCKFHVNMTGTITVQ